MTNFVDLYYPSADGRLTLRARDYGREANHRQAIICIHGLTRNSADFHSLATYLSGHYRVLSVDVRGRGLSQWDPDPSNYLPAVYATDVIRLLDYVELPKVTLIGTSMGGLIAMILGVTARERIQGMVINDVGPELDPTGLARIASYTGKTRPVSNWTEAAEMARLTNEVAFPDYGAADWMVFAERLYIEDANGIPVLAYDPAISKGLEANSQSPVVPPDLWPLWDGLEGVPVLAIRGGLSDLLSAATLEKMAQRHPGMAWVTLPNRGHAPMLDEPLALSAIEAFLEEVKG